jgi:hypothetical protein
VTTMMMIHGCWREPVAATMQQHVDMGNAARGWGRRHQAIEDDGTGRCDPAKYLIYQAN